MATWSHVFVVITQKIICLLSTAAVALLHHLKWRAPTFCHILISNKENIYKQISFSSTQNSFYNKRNEASQFPSSCSKVFSPINNWGKKHIRCLNCWGKFTILRKKFAHKSGGGASLSSTSHRCWIRLSSGGFGGRVNTSNSSLCSSNIPEPFSFEALHIIPLT